MFMIYLWSFYPRGHVFASDVVIWKDRNDKSSKFILFIDRKQSSHIIQKNVWINMKTFWTKCSFVNSKWRLGDQCAPDSSTHRRDDKTLLPLIVCSRNISR